VNTLILNRDFKHPDDGWYMVESKGNHPNRAAGVVQVIDDEATQSIVNRFNADAAAGKLRHGHEMLIDHEHFSDQPDQETRAYGWLQGLQNRDDGIYGQIRWTATGKAAVDGGDYRFFSTEYSPEDLKIVNDGKTKSVRPLALAGLTLTNMNNNRGQKPITNREDPAPPNLADADALAANQQKKDNQEKMKNIALKLGLAAEASEEAILAGVTKLQNRETELAPVAAENTTLKTRLASLDGEQVDGLLETHGVKDPKIINRLKPVLTVLKNREERVAALVDFGFTLPVAGSLNRVLNRGTGNLKPGEGDETVQTERAIRIANRASAIIKETPTISLATAYHMAAKENK